MNLLEDLLRGAVRDGNITVNVSFKADDLVKIIESKCYKILSEIQDIIRDPDIDDPECFNKVEELVCLLEREGLSAGFRHDFG